MGKLFGTDGIRGIAYEKLTADLAFRIGFSTATILKQGRDTFIIGKDTRESSDMLEKALSDGICAAGCDVVSIGVIPTPAVAYLTCTKKARAGFVISASHNSYEYNGIKVFGCEGYKIPDETENIIEDMILTDKPYALCEERGAVTFDDGALYAYSMYIKNALDVKLSSMRVLFDCANGSAYKTAYEIFSDIGIEADFIHTQPDGKNINLNCGSTHMDLLAKRVKEGKYDMGIAFDGDADRCLAVDENGNTVDGDKIMALCGKRLLSEGKLNHNTIVATVMSNMGFHKYLKDNNMSAVCASVGDRYVLEQMLKGGFNLGGEQSGHIIFKDFSTTGDGELTAIKLISLVNSSDKTLSELVSEIPTYPQILLNVKVSTEIKRTINTHEGIKAETEKMSALLGNSGRILLRPSGTEDLVRIMVEADTMEKARDVAEKLQEVVLKSCCL